MDETPRKRLARLIAGVPADSSPMPNFATGANQNMSPMPNGAAGATVPASNMPNFAAPGSSSAYLPPLKLPPPAQKAGPYDFLPPFSGARNDMSLPPFEQPGGSLPMERYMNPSPPPAAPPAMAPMPAAPPMPAASGGQGWGGPEPAPGTIPLEYDPMQDPRYLPEQWKGAFNPRWQK